MTNSHYKRRRKLIDPKLQFTLTAIFAGMTLLALLSQALVFSSLLASAAERMPMGGDYLLNLIPSLLGNMLLFSILLLVPVNILVGVLVTFRMAGPVYRFKTYLRSVVKGEQSEPCRIRTGDAFVELCDLINEATQSLLVPVNQEGDTEADVEPEELRKAS